MPFGEVAIDLGIIGDILLVVFAVWFTNAFNFMDGIDGIAASEAVCIAGGAMVIGLPEIGSTSILAAILAAASFGFLVWNWPPASIFMGDVGSAFLGLMLVGVGLYSEHQNAISLWSWLILSGVFVVDSKKLLCGNTLNVLDVRPITRGNFTEQLNGFLNLEVFHLRVVFHQREKRSQRHTPIRISVVKMLSIIQRDPRRIPLRRLPQQASHWEEFCLVGRVCHLIVLLI